MAKKDVTKGLDPDLFDAGLDDDESDKEEITEEGSSEEEAPSEETPSVAEEAPPTEEEASEEAAADESKDEEQKDDVPEEAVSEENDPESEEATEEGTADESTEKHTEENDGAPEEASKKGDGGGEDGGDPSKEEEPIAPADIDSIAATYVVQRGFTDTNGKTYHPGDVIPIQCRHCALWEREWLGKKRCSPGRRLDEDTVMHPERYSCETFFICKENDPELTTFLNMSVPEILTVRAMLPGIKKILRAADFLDKWAEREDFKGDKGEVFTNAKGFVTVFSSLEQLLLAEGFMREYIKAASKRAAYTKRPPRPKFEPGDWIEWKDLKTGETIEGILLSKGAGNIHFAGTKVHAGQKFTFKLKEWKKKCEPKITRKTSSPDVE